MFRARMSYKLFWFLTRSLPDRAASQIVRLLGLKIPTTPAALAACLVELTGSMVNVIEKAVAEFHRTGPNTTINDSAPLEAAAEVVSALYCLAVAVISEDEFASDPNLYQLYTAKTFQELGTLQPKTKSSALLETVIDEATRLYLHDTPNLTELAHNKLDFAYVQEVEKVVSMNNWTTTFCLKAKIQILEKLGIRTTNLAYDILGQLILIGLIEDIRFFRQMRPSFR